MIAVDPTSGTPPFEQVRAAIAGDVHSGALVAGARLPTVRALAEELGLAVNTVARAYKELEAAGLVESRGRNGTVVAWSADAATGAAEQAAAAYAARVRELGVPAEEARRIVERALGAP